MQNNLENQLKLYRYDLGQDVDCIIISFASSDENYIEDIHGFLFNHNRLNVMISRAKTKVVLFCSQEIQNQLKDILNIEER
jgi:superfamily I DNA and/or RNA helicase